MMLGLAIEGGLARSLYERLLVDASERGIFCRLRSVTINQERRFVLASPIDLPLEWFSSSLGHVTPSGKAISAAVSAAEKSRMGLAFIHTHPASSYPPRLSTLDLKTSARLSIMMRELVDGDFVSLVLGPGGWAGVAGRGAEPLVALDRIWVIDTSLLTHSREEGIKSAKPSYDPFDDRQALALGEASARLRECRVVVVGAGGIGSPVAETLARIGVRQIRLIDNDLLDTPSNARRVFGTTRKDVLKEPARPKSEVVAEALNRLDLGTDVEPIVGDIRDRQILSRILGADVVIGATDSHSSRASIARTCIEGMIPYIDVGARVGRRRIGSLDALLFERRIQLPSGPCLWCWDVLDPERIRYELLPAPERTRLVEEGYVTGLPAEPEPSIAALTVTAAGAACAALVGLIAGALSADRLGSSLELLSMESYTMRGKRNPDCVCRQWRTPIGPDPDDLA